MRTTICINDDLYAEVKTLAARTGRTVKAVVEEALRDSLQRRDRARRKKPRVRLPTFGGGGVQPGVDLDDSASLLDLMEGVNDPYRRQRAGVRPQDGRSGS
jgi:hypothetical protein